MEIVRCDGCNEDIKRNTYFLELNKTSKGLVFSTHHEFTKEPTQKHFCSFDCVCKWVDKERGNKKNNDLFIDKSKLPLMIHPNT